MSEDHALPVQARGGIDSPVQAELCGFTSRMLEQCGALVEWNAPESTGIAMLPKDVASLLNVEETVPLALRQEPGALCLSLASDFLEQAEHLLDSLVPRVGAFQIPDHYLKKGDLQTAIDRLFTWHNARVKVRSSTPREVEYHSWWFFASLKSEDIWESRLNVTINAASLAPVDLPDLLGLPELESGNDQPSTRPETTYDAAINFAQSRLLNEAQSFIQRTESRLDRDRKRLRDYYGALKREAGSAKRRNTKPPTESEEEIEALKRAVNLELQRKLLELDERYQMEASLEPIALVCLKATVLAVELLVQRRQANRIHLVYWNPLSKQFEPMRCDACGRGTFSVAFTDEKVAPLCARCHTSGNVANPPDQGVLPAGRK